ncbi:hypothetical protein Bca52824_092310 [Brassica carinata]|uniref:Uncharacterized protein n=1 Tax=Brassica carinata TaxID=52824 RepID=A0A8X7NSW7_BRACI|nr:hypothetical protein Bca52824_092310 [Brassica carinata]
MGLEVEDTLAENIIKVMYGGETWKWTMDCREVTGTKVNTKPKVVTPSKKAKEMVVLEEEEEEEDNQDLGRKLNWAVEKKVGVTNQATPPPLTNQATPQDKQPTLLPKKRG